MHCHLLIPNLFLELPSGQDPFQGLQLPALATLVGRSQRQSLSTGSVETWLCGAFGVKKQQDWSIAALTLAADGGDPKHYYWFRADPVHLRVQRDQIILADSATLSISQKEADELVHALNRHFESDGMLFYALRPDRWYLRLTTPPHIQTHPLPDVAGKNINDYLPFGLDGMRWHTLFNEMQMLFHSHPINEAREMRGEMPINSVWIWGGGTLPDVSQKPYGRIWANDALAQALAFVSQTPFECLPETATALLGQGSASEDSFILLDSLRGAGQYGDVYGWQEGLSKLEQDWFTPLLQALGQRKLTTLTIHAAYINQIQSYTITPRDLWKIWRRIKPLKSYAKPLFPI